jgi:hypothetical protein
MSFFDILIFAFAAELFRFIIYLVANILVICLTKKSYEDK